MTPVGFWDGAERTTSTLNWGGVNIGQVPERKDNHHKVGKIPADEQEKVKEKKRNIKAGWMEGGELTDRTFQFSGKVSNFLLEEWKKEQERKKKEEDGHQVEAVVFNLTWRLVHFHTSGQSSTCSQSVDNKLLQIVSPDDEAATHPVRLNTFTCNCNKLKELISVSTSF